MKRILLIVLLVNGFNLISMAQNYDHILNYNLNGNQTYGVKIKTNLPFEPDGGMPTITIKGYNYGAHESIDLTLTYYIWYDNARNDPANYYFYFPTISSAGSYTPPIYLSNEGGKVVIYIDDRGYFQRFTISAFGLGDNEVPAWFQNWAVLDEPLSGIKTVLVPYKNKFKGQVFMPGDGIWQDDGSVGIGTTNTAGAKLAIKGNIHAQEVKVDMNGWADYVFKPDYELLPLLELKTYVDKNRHLPGIPSTEEVVENGLNLGEMNAKLLKKIEELTLYLVNQNEQIIKQNEVNQKQNETNKRQDVLIDRLSKKISKSKK